ncbi:MAG: GAF domain-containing protein [Anaerolineae bacterium]
MTEPTAHLIRFLQQENLRLQTEVQALRQEKEALLAYLKALEHLYLAAQDLTSEADLIRLLDNTMHYAIHLAHASDGSVLLLDQATDELVFAVVHGDKQGELRGYRLPAGTGIAGWVATHRQPIIANQARQDARFSPHVDEVFGFVTRSLVCVPMIAHNQVIGVIEVLNKDAGAPFTEVDVNLLLILGSIAAGALEMLRVRLEAPETDAAARH